MRAALTGSESHNIRYNLVDYHLQDCPRHYTYLYKIRISNNFKFLKIDLNYEAGDYLSNVGICQCR